eukprot:GEZU01006525.1.p1 GENE.GEZU01006525.1~~GEZU01006525.1.p1  ORF type:complete len:142 (+),score=29.84 GEZU01006525.1:113-538(+)
MGIALRTLSTGLIGSGAAQAQRFEAFVYTYWFHIILVLGLVHLLKKYILLPWWYSIARRFDGLEPMRDQRKLWDLEDRMRTARLNQQNQYYDQASNKEAAAAVAARLRKQKKNEQTSNQKNMHGCMDAWMDGMGWDACGEA